MVCDACLQPSLNMYNELRWQGLGEAFSGSFFLRQEEGEQKKSRFLSSEAEGHLKGHICLRTLCEVQCEVVGSGQHSKKQGSKAGISSSLETELREKNEGWKSADSPFHTHKGPDSPASPPTTAVHQTRLRNPSSRL
ncbi:mCG147678 [Mus musculus]|jgi:hypothetical protein|nr:mCG147678 [Mus musculus]